MSTDTPLGVVASDECLHGMDARDCTICLHGVSSATTETIEASFRAGFPGHCPGCDLPIVVGQMINRMATGRYLHAGCD